MLYYLIEIMYHCTLNKNSKATLRIGNFGKDRGVPIYGGLN